MSWFQSAFGSMVPAALVAANCVRYSVGSWPLMLDTADGTHVTLFCAASIKSSGIYILGSSIPFEDAETIRSGLPKVKMLRMPAERETWASWRA